MTMPQSVQLRQITEENARELAVGARGVNLGDKQQERRLNDLLAQIRQDTRVYLLDWEGSKVPRGVTIEGKVIAWTQNGMVVATDHSTIGTYDRTIEFGGESRQHHQMLIYV